jgi:hypothetical protein
MPARTTFAARGGRPSARGRDKRKSSKRCPSPVGNSAKPAGCFICDQHLIRKCYWRDQLKQEVREELKVLQAPGKEPAAPYYRRYLPPVDDIAEGERDARDARDAREALEYDDSGGCCGYCNGPYFNADLQWDEEGQRWVAVYADRVVRASYSEAPVNFLTLVRNDTTPPVARE